MKSSKKKKIFAALAVFSVLTGSAYAADTIVDITINQPYERTGIELGTDSYARGEGSIATGKNSVAIGKGATATGSNETADTIQAKLEENRLKLQEIEDKQKSVKQMGDDLNALKIREQKTIEAGIRVEQIRKAKANAKNVWDNAETAWKDKVDGTADAIAEHNRKLADLNSRLTGVSQLTHSDISTPEGLTAAAEELKGKAEQGTSMNLSVDFYKDYVSNYYKALGDLRLNNKVISDHGKRTIIDQIRENPLHRDLDGIVLQYNDHYTSGFSNNTKSVSSTPYSTYSSSSYSPYSSSDYANARAYNSLGEYAIDKNGIARVNGLRDGGKQVYNGEIYQTCWNIKSDVVDQTTFDKWNSAKEGWRSQIHDANRRSGDEVFGKFDTLTGGKSTTLFNMVTDMKFELVDLDYQICYYQGQYEATHDKTWLDKKKAAMDQRQQKLNTNEQTIKDKYRELFGEDLSGTDRLFHIIGQNIKNQWKQENIVDIEEKNKITTDKLTGELERELGINKSAIQQYEKEIQNLRNKADQARKNFEGLNPSAEDLLLAREYERVAKELQDKADALKKEADELEELKKNLKLNELKDKGADAIAYGTNALVTGNAAIGIGKDVIVTGKDGIALGRQNTVSGTQSAAIGTNNTVTGDQTFVLGSGVITKAKNAVVLGAGSTGEDNTVSVGSAGKERRIINVAPGQIEASSTDVVNGSQLYELAQNPSTATGMNKENWQQFLGDGTNTSGSKGLVTGDTLYKAIQSIDVTDQIAGKADTDLKNITNDGKTVIKNIAKDSVKVVDGTNTTVTETTDKDGNKNYAVNVEANGKIAENDTGIVNGNTVYQAIKDKADKTDITNAVKNKADVNAGNVTGENKKAWQEKLGDGKIAAGDKGLVNGDTVNNAINNIKKDVNTSLDGKADTDLKNITNDGKTVIKNIAKDSVKVVDGTNTTVTETTDKDGNKNYAVNVEANGKIAENDTGIVNGNTVYQAIKDKADKSDITNAVKDKADTDLKNITNDGKTVIKNIAKDSVKVVDGTNTTVTETTDKDGNKNYAVNVEANGKNEEGNTGLINGDTLYKAIKDVDVSEAVKNKADTNLKNITNDGKTVIKNIAKDSVKVVDGTNTTVTETTDKDGNKNYAVNVEANGKIEKNNNNIVTGGTVYQAIEDKSLVKTDGKTISIDKNGTANVIDVSHTVNGKTEGRIISGVITDPKNPYSVANVSYVNTSISNVVQEMSSGMKRLEKDLGNAGAGAAALSALEYDEIEPGQKWQIAAGVGNYKGSTAYALGAKYHLNNDISFHIGSTIGNGNNMVNGGFSIALGHAKKKIDNDSMKRLDQMQKEINDLKEQNKQLIQALEKVNKLFLLNPSKKASFPDVPADHWAKNAVDVLHGNGAIEGYPDGTFKGDRKMSRYEYAEMLYNALMNGAAVDESVVEKYQPELVQIYSEKNR